MRQARIHLINNNSAIQSPILVTVWYSKLKWHRTRVWKAVVWILQEIYMGTTNESRRTMVQTGIRSASGS